MHHLIRTERPASEVFLENIAHDLYEYYQGGERTLPLIAFEQYSFMPEDPRFPRYENNAVSAFVSLRYLERNNILPFPPALAAAYAKSFGDLYHLEDVFGEHYPAVRKWGFDMMHHMIEAGHSYCLPTRLETTRDLDAVVFHWMHEVEACLDIYWDELAEFTHGIIRAWISQWRFCYGDYGTKSDVDPEDSYYLNQGFAKFLDEAEGDELHDEEEGGMLHVNSPRGGGFSCMS